MTLDYTLSPQMLATAFPFHLVINHDLQIIQTGTAIQRLYSQSLVGSLLTDRFSAERPPIDLTWDTLKKHTKSLFILRSLHHDIQLKGQIILADSDELLFFLGSLWVDDVSSLTTIGIKLKDFAIHDPTIDYLFLRKTTDTSLQEVKKLTEELIFQQTQLQQALVVKDNLAKIAKSQANRLEDALKNLQQAQSQLVQTEKMSSLGQMVAGVAHEINNPVSFIHGNLKFAREYIEDLLQLVALYRQKYPASDPDIEAFCEQIEFDFLIDDLPQMMQSMYLGTDRIRNIVASLRVFSRLDEAEHKSVNIHDGLDSTLLLLKHRLNATSDRPEIQVIHQYGELPNVECYAGQLNQVFMNILSNAIDALNSWDELQSSPPQIQIKTSVDTPETILIEIADTGIGIPETERSRLFDPFFTTKPIGQGTGLGLSISYQIVVEKHGGRLWCESAVNQGTTFFIQLPQVLGVMKRDYSLTKQLELTQ
ncbi:ATP-binding protein [Calothrix sp. 336/3]|uniref:ATP-binding protein n=1 Tax=Calothrix sp. 336/3 TaxID=1337936 RepID=UPI0005524216|nr:ATP-binding protein [Calothrix sp. 336/3]AKG20915.1 histidine kinase [Calothrix sp. 336/3]